MFRIYHSCRAGEYSEHFLGKHFQNLGRSSHFAAPSRQMLVADWLDPCTCGVFHLGRHGNG